MRFAIVFLLGCAFVRADTLSDLRQKLATASDTGPVTVQVAFESVSRKADQPATAPQKVTLLASEGPDGLQLRWPREVIVQAADKREAEGKPNPMREALEGLKPTDVHDYLNIAGQLHEQLGYAELTEERNDTWQGKPARRLALKLNPPLSKEDRKYIKELNASATLWLDAEGWPIAAERQVTLKGRAMLVITFEQSERESFEFLRTGGRLITVRHEKSSRGSGGGESGEHKSTTTLRLAES